MPGSIYRETGESPLSLRAALEAMHGEDLRRLVALTGQKPPTRKADMAALVVEHLSGARLDAVWEALDEIQRSAIAEAVHGPSPCFFSTAFEAKYGRSPDWGEDRKPSPLCFFFYNSRIPEDLKTRLLTLVPQPRPLTIDGLDQLPPAYQLWDGRETQEVPLAVHDTESAAQRDLFSVLRLVDAGRVAVSEKTRRPSTSAMQAVTAVLESGDYYQYEKPEYDDIDPNAGPIRAFAWPMLIQAGGLAQIHGSRLRLTRAGRKALIEPAAATIRTLWLKWLGTTLLDELSRIECVKGQGGKGKRGLTPVWMRRETIAEILMQCPTGKWIATADLYRYSVATSNEIEVSRDNWYLYICDQWNGSLAETGGEEMLDERYLLAVLLEYAATLGMIDVALIPPEDARRDFLDLPGGEELPYFSRYDGLMYFRLTPLGAYCLDMLPDHQPTPVEVSAVLRVLPNLEIAATGSGLEQSDRLALDAYAIPVSEFVWRLEPGRLLAAIESGRQIDEIRDFLVARGAGELPGTVSRLLDDTSERASQIHEEGPALLVRCADDALAARIANDKRTRKHCMLAGKQHLVVPNGSEAAFRRGLRETGYLLSAGTGRSKG